jgi:uncharacterized protein (DUF2141 family)
MTTKTLVIKIFLLLLLPAMTLNAQNVEVTITGIRSEKGRIVIGVFKDEESYKTEVPFVTETFVKNITPDGEMSVRFSLEPGVYGLCLLDDEDNDGIMHYNFMGMPKEGFGFSNLHFMGFTKPKFDTFRFSIEKGQTERVTIRVRYIL